MADMKLDPEHFGDKADIERERESEWKQTVTIFVVT